MKKTKLPELPIVPEKYGCEVYERIDWSAITSWMTDAERKLINGLIQYYQPENVLEVGIAAGGGRSTCSTR
ncbi:MAG: hypothetical protein FWH17_03455 [Oscillospiraceae bacterium]|nr:hypothetical protein [Oscillospiraceae bacterium]